MRSNILIFPAVTLHADLSPHEMGGRQTMIGFVVDQHTYGKQKSLAIIFNTGVREARYSKACADGTSQISPLEVGG